MPKPLIEVRNLKMYFPVGGSLLSKRKLLKAVDDVSFDLYPGETFGLVGESGCGKTTIGRSLVRLYQPTAGQILLDGTDIAPMDERTVLPYRRRMQMIFQDPYASLNPRMTVSSIIGEPMRLQLLEHVDHLRLNGHVQRRDRLVADDELRPGGQGAGDADALALAAGELVGVAVEVIPLEPHLLDQFADAPGDFVGPGALQAHRLADDAGYGHARIQ